MFFFLTLTNLFIKTEKKSGRAVSNRCLGGYPNPLSRLESLINLSYRRIKLMGL